MNFWTDDIDADDVSSPQEIMKEAADELENRSGKLAVSIDESTLPDRIVFAFVVFRRDIGARLNLFEISHQVEHPYPARINPPDADIPEFLQEHRFVPGSPGMGIAGLQRAMEGTPGKYVKNEWVCATPSDVRQKLKELFSRNVVRSRIVSLLARRANHSGRAMGEAGESDDDAKGDGGARA